MASVNFHKCKAGTGEAGALLRHCDARERLEHEQKNVHIDHNLTPLNRQGPLSYRQTLRALRARLAELDAAPGANRRKDRVECFVLEVPIPDGYDPMAFTKMAVGEIVSQYGARNVLNFYMHADEVHDYMDHGMVRTSLRHIHVPVVPEVGGRLCGKKFSSRERMQELNRRIDRRAREMGGPGFLTGEEARKRSVEELKIASYQEAAEAAERARNAQEKAEDSLRAVKAQVEAQEAVLGRIRGSGGLSDRKRYKTLGGDEYIRITPQEAVALDAAVAVKTPLLEAEASAAEILRTARQEADRIEAEAHHRVSGALMDAKLAKTELEHIKREHPEIFGRKSMRRSKSDLQR